MKPAISIIVLNYNGEDCIRRCLDSVISQTIFPLLEIIVVDNASTDGSEQIVCGYPQIKTLISKENLYFCKGNNAGASIATGEYLFFLNNDAWLEIDCLEKLLVAARASYAGAASPVVLDYHSDDLQTLGSPGFDWCALPTQFSQQWGNAVRETFSASGCALLIESDLFRAVGGFDPAFQMYCEEGDLSWRVLAAGRKIITAPSARAHHRDSRESKQGVWTTSAQKRYLTNRNSILNSLKNSQHILLLLVLPQLALLFLECLMSVLLIGWSFSKRAYWDACRDAIGLLPVVRQRRQQTRLFRQKGDFWMLRFLNFTPARLGDWLRVFTHGIPRTGT